jgi:Arc/MetJ-type ribon-helix-helix transcriptional regulator
MEPKGFLMPATKTIRRSVAMTPDMRARLEQLLTRETRDVTEADLIRQAIREFLDRQENITGSKAHFRKAFQARIDELQNDLEFHLHVIIALLAHGLAVMLPVFTEQPITPLELIQAAIVSAQQNADSLRSQIDTVREQ